LNEVYYARLQHYLLSIHWDHKEDLVEMGLSLDTAKIPLSDLQ
jgi:hypothetical protein